MAVFYLQSLRNLPSIPNDMEGSCSSGTHGGMLTIDLFVFYNPPFTHLKIFAAAIGSYI